MNTPIITGTYREIQIVNGQIVKNVELEEQVSPEKDVIKGSIDGKPVFMERKLRLTKRRHKKSNKKNNKSRTNKSLSKQSKKTAKK